MARKNHEEYVEELKVKNPKVIVMENYINAYTPILHKCKIHNYEWMVSPSNILKRDGCPKCNGKYRRSHDDYVEELKVINPNIEVLGTYVNARTEILHRCKTHNVIWMKRPTDALKGTGCKQCGNDKLSNLFSKTHEEYVAELNAINPNIEVIGEYSGMLNGILHRCKIDKYEWITPPSSLLSGSGCPKCNGGYKRTKNEYIEELKNINPNIEIVGEFKNISTKATFTCKICDNVWTTMPEVTLRGSGCPRCGNKRIGEKLSKTHEQYLEEVDKLGINIEVIEHYRGTSTKIKHRCKIDGYIWEVSPTRILNGSRCPLCCTPYKINHELYLLKIANSNPNVLPIEEYKGASVKILHKCLLCNNEWKTMPQLILRGCGCPECGKYKISQRLLKGHDEYVSELNKLNPDVIVIDKYVNCATPIKHRCKIDNYEWYAPPSYMLSGCKCPSCCNSKGEFEVKSWLESKNIKYVTQKKFEDCKDKRCLPFDFYLPDYNLCIEYDGEQHYRPVGFGCKDNDLVDNRFELTKYHDAIKTEYCETKGIRLIRIPYFDNVKEKLDLLLT